MRDVVCVVVNTVAVCPPPGDDQPMPRSALLALAIITAALVAAVVWFWRAFR